MTLQEQIAFIIDSKAFDRTGPVTEEQERADRNRRGTALNKARKIIAILPETAQQTYSAETVEAVCARVKEIAKIIQRGNGA